MPFAQINLIMAKLVLTKLTHASFSITLTLMHPNKTVRLHLVFQEIWS